MVNGVSSNYGYVPRGVQAATAAYVNNQNNVENMVKYLNGQPLTTSAEPTIMDSAKGSVPFIAIFGGIQGIGALKNNGLTGYAAKRLAVLKKHGLAKGWQIGETIRNVNASIPYTARSQALTAGKNAISQEFRNIFTKTATTTAPTGFFGKLMAKIPGYTAIKNSGFGQAMGKSGAGWMMAIEGGIEMFTNVVPTFQTLGAGSGFKQLGKSTLKVAGSAVGWVGGSAIGKGIGAAIGTFICPGIGTAIGSFIGSFLGGCVGSAVTGKVTKAITGPSELEKYNNQQISAIAQQAEADPATKVAIAQQTLDTANQTLAQDPQNADALAAKASAEAVLAEAQAVTPELPAEGYPQQPMQPVYPTQQGNQVPYAMNEFGIPVVPGFSPMGYDMNIYNSANQKAAMSGVLNPFGIQNQYGIYNQYRLQNPFISQTTETAQ